MNSSDILDLIRKRHATDIGTEWVVAEEVCATVGSHASRIDALAVSCWRRSSKMVRGFEIKVTRQDFLRELERPEKREPWQKMVNEFWFACGPGVARIDEIPAACGFLEATKTGSKLIKRKAAKYEEGGDLTPDAWRSLVRNVDTAGREARGKLDSVATLNGKPVSHASLLSLARKFWGSHIDDVAKMRARELTAKKREENKQGHRNYESMIRDVLRALGERTWGEPSIPSHEQIVQLIERAKEPKLDEIRRAVKDLRGSIDRALEREA